MYCPIPAGGSRPESTRRCEMHGGRKPHAPVSRLAGCADLKRRNVAVALAAAPLLAYVPRARAGAQIYEPLADSVRNALAAQIADSRPPVRSFVTHEARMAFVDWLEAMSKRLRARK